jgi:predicted transcriptional regulator
LKIKEMLAVRLLGKLLRDSHLDLSDFDNKISPEQPDDVVPEISPKQSTVDDSVLALERDGQKYFPIARNKSTK